MNKILRYILEAETVKRTIWAKKAEAFKIQDALKNTFKELKGNKFSTMNKQELPKLYKAFIKNIKVNFGDEVETRKALQEYGMSTEKGFGAVIRSNQKEFEMNKFDISCIKDFDMKTNEAAYKKAKDAGELPNKVDVNKDDYKDYEGRTIIVYDRYDPTTYQGYEFDGKRGSKGAEQMINFARMDFKYEFDVKYYDCYTCLPDYFFTHDKANLSGNMQDIDPNEFK